MRPDVHVVPVTHVVAGELMLPLAPQQTCPVWQSCGPVHAIAPVVAVIAHALDAVHDVITLVVPGAQRCAQHTCGAAHGGHPPVFGTQVAPPPLLEPDPELLPELPPVPLLLPLPELPPLELEDSGPASAGVALSDEQPGAHARPSETASVRRSEADFMPETSLSRLVA